MGGFTRDEIASGIDEALQLAVTTMETEDGIPVAWDEGTRLVSAFLDGVRRHRD